MNIKAKVSHQFMRLHPLSREIDPRIQINWVVERAAVSNAKRYCYFRIPKCANSSVVTSLVHYDPTLSLKDGDTSAHLAKSCFGKLVAARAISVERFAEKYFCFTFVRNPYTRLLSAYLDKIAGRNDPAKYRFVGVATGHDEADQVSFPEFISYLENGGLFSNPHWAPQTSLIPIKLERVAFVGYVEALDEGLQRVIDTIFGPGTYQVTHSRETRRQGAANQLSRFFSDELYTRVHALYASDFEAFGYSSDPECIGK